MRALRIP
jgi:hypothetical protein